LGELYLYHFFDQFHLGRKPHKTKSNIFMQI
jgi:hypothetical protein